MTQQPLTLEEIHTGTLEILKKFICICDAIHINYFIAYGTLIGAVRHHGFIPWDDDFDIMLLRPDYDAFEAYCLAHEQELLPFKLMGRCNTPDYPYNINRFCDLRYRMESFGMQDAGMGMFVDLYPLDGVGSDPERAVARFAGRKKFHMTMVTLLQSKRGAVSTKGKLHAAAKRTVRALARPLGAKFFLNRLMAYRNKFPLSDSDYVSCVVWDGNLIPYHKRHFQGYEMLDFEGIPVKAPLDYDSLLRQYYGDYMRLPPPEARVPHHEYNLYRKSE